MFSTPENLLIGISGALGTQEKTLCQQKCVWRKCCEISQKWWMLELSNLCHYVQHPWKLTSRAFRSSREERKPLCQQKCVWRKCCGVSSASRSRGRSAKFEPICTTRCQSWGVDLPADLPKLNSSWPLDVSTGEGVDLLADLQKLNSSWPLDVNTGEGVDLPKLNSSWPLDVSTREWSICRQIFPSWTHPDH